jgi:hypothetical protein
MVISNQAPHIFNAVFSHEEAKRPETCARFLRVIGCINLYSFQSDYSVNALRVSMLSGCGGTTRRASPWWKRMKEFRHGIHPLIQLTSASSSELTRLGFDMTPEVDLDIIVRVWNETLKSLRKDS